MPVWKVAYVKTPEYQPQDFRRGARRHNPELSPSTTAPVVRADRGGYRLLEASALGLGGDERFHTDLTLRRNGQPDLELVRYRDPTSPSGRPLPCDAPLGRKEGKQVALVRSPCLVS